jgi:hypothetical protein
VKKETRHQRELRHNAIYGRYESDLNPKRPIEGFPQKPIRLKCEGKKDETVNTH